MTRNLSGGVVAGYQSSQLLRQNRPASVEDVLHQTQKTTEKTVIKQDTVTSSLNDDSYSQQKTDNNNSNISHDQYVDQKRQDEDLDIDLAETLTREPHGGVPDKTEVFITEDGEKFEVYCDELADEEDGEEEEETMISLEEEEEWKRYQSMLKVLVG